MVTYQLWLQKFPQFVAFGELQFDAMKLEATIEMGSSVGRWLGQETYDVAQGYLISHFATLAEAWEIGDHSPIQPFRTKQVDDVMIESAVSRDMQNNFDPYLATTYGQQYIKWRRIVFAGPRVV